MPFLITECFNEFPLLYTYTGEADIYPVHDLRHFMKQLRFAAHPIQLADGKVIISAPLAAIIPGFIQIQDIFLDPNG